MSKSILYSVKLGGSNESVINLKNLIDSIVNLTYFKNFQIQIFYEDNINENLKIFIKKSNIINVSYFKFEKLSWYKWLKISFERAQAFEYLVTMHSDCYFLTKDFDLKFINEVKDTSNIGVFSFLDEAYKLGFFYPQLRPGFQEDIIYSKSNQLAISYEFHNQNKNWHIYNIRLKKILNLTKIKKNFFFDKLSKLNYEKIDLPKKKIRVHSIWSHVVCFKTSNLNYFSNIADFDVSHGLYADEDICLEAQKNNLINLFIPSISYLHSRLDLGQTRSFGLIVNDFNKVNNFFLNKWKFSPINDDDNLADKLEIIAKIEKKYGKNLTWTKNYTSYDWNSVYE